VDFEYVVDAVYSLDGKQVLVSGGEALTAIPVERGGRQRCRLELWDMPAAKGEPSLKSVISEQPMPLHSPVFSSNGRYIAAACGDWLVWEASSGKQLATMRAPQFSARSCAFSPNNLWIATGAIDSTVALFHTRDWIMDFQHTDDPSLDVTALKFNPSGAILVAARGKFVDLFQVR
jgi:WD40 repeat protein